MHVGLFTTFTRLPAPGQNTRIDKDTSKPAGGMYIYVAEGLVGWLVGWWRVYIISIWISTGAD